MRCDRHLVMPVSPYIDREESCRTGRIHDDLFRFCRSAGAGAWCARRSVERDFAKVWRMRLQGLRRNLAVTSEFSGMDDVFFAPLQEFRRDRSEISGCD